MASLAPIVVMTIVAAYLTANRMKQNRNRRIESSKTEASLEELRTTLFENSVIQPPVDPRDVLEIGGLADDLKTYMTEPQTPQQNQTEFIFLCITVVLLAIIALTLIAFNFVLPSMIIQKYNANNNDSKLVDAELYNISIALALFSSLTLVCLFLLGAQKRLVSFAAVFSLVLPALCIAKSDGNASITNYQLYVISICTLVFLVIGGGFGIRRQQKTE